MIITNKYSWLFSFLAILVSLAGVTDAHAQTNTSLNPKPDGTLIKRKPVIIPDSLKGVNSDTLKHLKESVNFYHITYISDGLKIKGYLATPKKDGKYPVIIYNRGGNRDFGALNDHSLDLALMAKWGYVVIGSNYRGGGGSEGKDQFGGKDVDDILNLIPLLANLPMADTTRMGIMGWSRGSMMTYEVMRKTCAFDAAVTGGNLTNLFTEINDRPKMENVFSELIPHYEENKDVALRKRSAIFWADQMCEETPLLMLEGSADWRVSPLQSFKLVKKLYKLKHPVRFYFFEGGDHGLGEYFWQVYGPHGAIREFFDYYVKNQKKAPSLIPHGL